MSNYTHILHAVEFSEFGARAGKRAVTLARQNNARLSLIRVVEFFPTDIATEMGLFEDVELEQHLLDNTRAKLADFAKKLGVEDATQWVELGATRHEILRVAEAQSVDLIVIGSHGHHGLQRLLGSTANSVLHGADCDVLAVRLQKQ
ncbi:MAG: universal stress protein [Gammaproteobacteria bacterium]